MTIVIDHETIGAMAEEKETITLQSYAVRITHRDPADRLLAATARVYELTLVTADKRLIRARPCSILSAG